MWKRALPLLVIAVLGLAIAGCGGDDGEGSGMADTAAEPTGSSAGSAGGEATPAQKPAGVRIGTGASDYGPILFDDGDRAIYLFERDGEGPSRCYRACAEAWPPVLTKGRPRATADAEAELLGTVKRDDGTLQATYDGHPLYYYVDDPPGEVLCHGVAEFGGLWLVVTPDGAPAA